MEFFSSRRPVTSYSNTKGPGSSTVALTSTAHWCQARIPQRPFTESCPNCVLNTLRSRTAWEIPQQCTLGSDKADGKTPPEKNDTCSTTRSPGAPCPASLTATHLTLRLTEPGTNSARPQTPTIPMAQTPSTRCHSSKLRGDPRGCVLLGHFRLFCIDYHSLDASHLWDRALVRYQ